MRTVDKALTLLGLFTDRRPEIGLSELARLAKLDKATVHRMTVALAAHGMLEQHPQTKAWRLGAGILRLARLREACFPVEAIVQPALERLAEQTGETAHASLLAGRELATIGIAESKRSNRVSIEPSLPLPFHATASGIAFLAFADGSLVNDILAGPLPRMTEKTDTDADSLRRRIARANRTGVGTSDMGFEMDVFGIAAPLFAREGPVCGAIAVASPSSRMTAAKKKQISAAVIDAAIQVTETLGGKPAGAFAKVAERLAA